MSNYIKMIKLFDPRVDRHEETAIIKVLKNHHWASGSGEGNVKKFEDSFKKFVNSKECVAVNSGTAALHLALSLFNIKNKEIILPSLSFVSTAHAIKYNGGIPVFVDVEPTTLCIDPKKIKKAITKKTTMILPVHFAGMACDLEEIQKISKKFGLKIVEDAAHASGTTYKNKKIGCYSDAVCFSFHPVKNLAMPSGGAITLNGNKTKKLKKVLKSRRWVGISDRQGSKYNVAELGWNYYMNEFSAAIGIEQLKKLKKSNEIRKKIAKRYSDELKAEWKMPYENECSYHIFWIVVKERSKFMKHMLKNKIETGIHYYPIHKMKYYNLKLNLPITENATKGIVSLPIHPNLTENEIRRVIKCANEFFSTY